MRPPIELGEGRPQLFHEPRALKADEVREPLTAQQRLHLWRRGWVREHQQRRRRTRLGDLPGQVEGGGAGVLPVEEDHRWPRLHGRLHQALGTRFHPPRGAATRHRPQRGSQRKLLAEDEGERSRQCGLVRMHRQVEPGPGDPRRPLASPPPAPPRRGRRGVTAGAPAERRRRDPEVSASSPRAALVGGVHGPWRGTPRSHRRDRWGPAPW